MPNGDIYEGGFKNSKFHGSGSYTSKKSGKKFVGEYVGGLKHG